MRLPYLITLIFCLFLVVVKLSEGKTVNNALNTRVLDQRIDLNAIANQYIVQFKNETPLIKIKQLFIDQVKQKPPLSTDLDNYLQQERLKMEQRYAEYKENLAKVIMQLRSRDDLDKIKQEVLGPTFLFAINAMVIKNITSQEVQYLKTLPYIRNVTPNSVLRPLLMDTVPLIEANRVWEFDQNEGLCAQSGKECLRGKGIRVAIIDSGIDVTHPDLGGTQERDFQKINNGLRKITVNAAYSQNFALFGSRLAYASEDKVLIYNFNTKQTDILNTMDNNYQPVRMVLNDHALVYYAVGLHDETPAIFLYDFITKEHYRILKTRWIGTFDIENENVVFTVGAEGDEPLAPRGQDNPEIYMYNITTKELKLIENNNLSSYSYFPQISNGKIAYLKEDFDFVNNKFVNDLMIYDILTQNKRVVRITKIETIKDFDRSKIYYTTSDPQDRLYNFESRESVVLFNANVENLALDELIKGEGAGQEVYPYRFVTTRVGYLGENTVFKDGSYDKTIYVQQLNKNSYGLVNIKPNAEFFVANQNKVCYDSDKFDIYCHDYNSGKIDYAFEKLFNEKVIGGYDFVTQKPDPRDLEGHGTSVAGIVAGYGPLKGVAPDAQLLIYKVATEGQLIAALERAVNDNAQVINLSLTTEGGLESKDEDPDHSPSVIAVDNIVVNAGVVVVAGAGNSGPKGDSDCWHGGDGTSNSICAPGIARKAITVGASYKKDYESTDWDQNPHVDMVTAYSSRGPERWIDDHGQEQILQKPDIIAPGSIICTAGLDTMNGTVCSTDAFNNFYVSFNGTSAATPVVSGAVALLKQKYPNWGPEQIKVALMNSAIDTGQAKNAQGSGRINVFKAMFYQGGSTFLRGDSNGDRQVNIADAIASLSFLFRGGNAPLCSDAADANDDGQVDISDPIFTLDSLFLSGQHLPEPFPQAGFDPTVNDDLICQ